MTQPKNNYAVDYTEKPFNGMKRQEFETRNAATKWILDNQATLYWTQVRKLNPESAHSKPIILDSADLSSRQEIKGTMATYFETGMECMGLVLIEDGKEGYDGLHFIAQGDILQPDGDKKVAMIKDREFGAQDGFRLSFYPYGYTLKEWVSLFNTENKRATLWKMRVTKIDPKDIP